MKHRSTLFSISFLLLLSSCANTENNKLIIGKWQGVAWLSNGSPTDHDAAGTMFIFDDKENYVFTYGTVKEAGTYKVENDMLFTKPAEAAEIMVRIAKLTADSLVFDMNRGGGAERLSLVRR